MKYLDYKIREVKLLKCITIMYWFLCIQLLIILIESVTIVGIYWNIFRFLNTFLNKRLLFCFS
jgi:hypothetical protein